MLSILCISLSLCFLICKILVWIRFSVKYLQSVKYQNFPANSSKHEQILSSCCCYCLVAQSWPHGLQHARLACPSPSPAACSNSCPLSRWCYSTISSVIPFSSHLQHFPASRSFPMNRLFDSGGQSTEASASASVLPMNIQGWFPLGWTGLIYCCPRDSQESSATPQFESIISLVIFVVQLSHPNVTTGKTIALTIWTFVGKVMFLPFNMLSRFVIAFLPRRKCLLISQLQSPSAEILEPKKIKSVTVSIVSPSICHEVMGLDMMIFIFWMLSLNWLFHSPFSPSSKGSLIPLCFLP